MRGYGKLRASLKEKYSWTERRGWRNAYECEKEKGNRCVYTNLIRSDRCYTKVYFQAKENYRRVSAENMRVKEEETRRSLALPCSLFSSTSFSFLLPFFFSVLPNYSSFFPLLLLLRLFLILHLLLLLLLLLLVLVLMASLLKTANGHRLWVLFARLLPKTKLVKQLVNQTLLKWKKMRM